jgi:hypothetical protein
MTELGELQRQMEETYGTRDRARGISATVAGLAEERHAEGTKHEHDRDPETRTDTGGDDGTRTHDPLLAKQVL